MLTIDRISELAKIKGISKTHICNQLGMERSWLQTVKKQNSTISPERLTQIADILGTTVEYLNGETDDPAVPEKEKSPSALDELLSDPLNKELFDKLSKLSSAKKKALLALIEDQESD